MICKKSIVLGLLILFVITGCEEDPLPNNSYQTKNVIIIVMDGARYSETWGDSTQQYIPSISKLAAQGYVNTNFFNNGVTKTVPGHVAILTGNYQEIDNGGREVPENPSIFHYWLQQKSKYKLSTWIVASKDKLEVLANTTDVALKDMFMPSTNCGVNGLGTGYRHDSITFNATLKIMSNYEPNLILVNFREPDYSAHQANWLGYLEGIRRIDSYIDGIWQYINEDLAYKDKTTLFITNDHGRHLDTIGTGYVTHGDGCEGCRHINLIAIGPDIKMGQIDSTKHEQIDIAATVAEILGLDMPKSQGKVIKKMFN